MNKKYPNPRKIPDTGRLRICVELIKKYNLKKKIIVDVGCSNGWLATRLEKNSLKNFIGIDPSKKAITYAKKYTKMGKYYVSTASKLPVKDDYVDYVTMFDVIEHVPKNHENDALNEAYRVLKKGGKLFLSTPNDNFLTNLLDPVWYFGHRHYKENKLKKIITKSGFKISSVEIKGNIWFSYYLLWIYLFKRITGNPLPRNKFLEKKDNKSFDNNGIHTIFMVATKK